MVSALIDLHNLEIRAGQAQLVTWQGREALRLENGLALVPDKRMQDARIDLLIGVEGPAYPGVAFRVADILNYDLAYAVPHVSGQWDALQYDPVFHGSNTWQLYYGPGYQQAAQVPTGRWFQLNVDWCGERASVSVDGGEPLVVDCLAHPVAAGRLGVWTFRPAYFSHMRFSDCEHIEGPEVDAPELADDIISAWFVENYGVLTCEPHGVTNLNRYLPTVLEKARLSRRFKMSEAGEVRFDFGFSDRLSLELDGETIFTGENKFVGFEDRASRGYAELGVDSVQRVLESGEHHLLAELAVSEGFGWGLVMAAVGEGLSWIQAELG